MQEEEKLPIWPRLRDMQVQTSIDFPLRRMNSVKNACSNYGVIYNRQYTTKIDKDKRIILVTRIK